MKSILRNPMTIIAVILSLLLSGEGEFKDFILYIRDASQESITPEYVDSVSEDFTDCKRNEVLSCRLDGKLKYGTYIRNVYEIDYLATNLVGLFGVPVDVDLNGSEKATITFKANKDNMNNVPMRNLIILYYNETDGFYDKVKSKTKGYEVSAEITSSGTYLLADCYVWYSAWGADMSDYAHDVTYFNDEFGFSVVMPMEVGYYNVGDYLKDDQNGGMTKQILMYNSSMSDKDIDMDFNYYENQNGFDSALEYYKTIKPGLDGTGYGYTTVAEIETIDIGGGKKGYIVTYGAKASLVQNNAMAYYEYGDGKYFALSYIVFNNNKELYKKVVNSLKTFRYN